MRYHRVNAHVYPRKRPIRLYKHINLFHLNLKMAVPVVVSILICVVAGIVMLIVRICVSIYLTITNLSLVSQFYSIYCKKRKSEDHQFEATISTRGNNNLRSESPNSHHMESNSTPYNFDYFNQISMREPSAPPPEPTHFKTNNDEQILRGFTLLDMQAILVRK